MNWSRSSRARCFATRANSGRGTLPSFAASPASMVAIFAVRITDGIGRPAIARLSIDTSPGQPRFPALVIMSTQSRPCASSMPPVEATSAGPELARRAVGVRKRDLDDPASTLARCGGRRSKTLRNHVENHFESTGEGESGILVGVHSAELLKDAEWVAPSSLSNSVRMNRNNLLGHHD
jgi:hypothetical protein